MVKALNNIFIHFGTARETADDIKRFLGLEYMIILDQVHDNNGHVITQENKCMPFKAMRGDFLVTTEKNIGLGILTADCLPIIFVDTKHTVVGIAHAGWRSSVKNIVGEVLLSMQKNYGTAIQDLSIFFGPCAQVCCYQIQKDFLAHILPFSFALRTIVQRDNCLFFDVPVFNKNILLSLGLPQTAFNEQYNYCTICNEDYFSHRRQGDAAGRQVSVVVIK